jgi:hypothetical protein
VKSKSKNKLPYYIYISPLLPLVNLHLLILTTTNNTDLGIPLHAKHLDAVARHAALAALARHDKHAVADALAAVIARAPQVPDPARAVVAAGHELVARVGVFGQRHDGVGVPAQRQRRDGLRGLARVDERDVLGGRAAGYQVRVWQVADGEEGLRGGARVDAGRGCEVPGLERVVPGCAVGDCVVF